jgi:hypothetical protein
MIDDNFSICINCFSNDSIKKIITDNGECIDNCDFCNNKNLVGLTKTSISKIIPFIQCYLIYHYDEVDYNRRFGDRSIYETFEEEKEIFEWEIIKGKEKEGDLLDTVFDLFDSDIVEFSDHCACIEAIKKNTYSRDLIDIAETQGFKDKFDKINRFIEDIEKLSISDYAVEKYYRARIGAIKNKDKPYSKKPFEGNEIVAPPNNLASSGRSNREFISFLYLSEDIETAVQEVRPLPGDDVSVGEFASCKSLNLFYLYSHDILGHSDLYESIIKLKKIAALNNYFSKPTGTSGKSMYVVTQMFVEALALKGYDGIAFESSFTKKANYTIFNPNDCRYIENSSRLYHIQNIKVGMLEERKRWQ